MQVKDFNELTECGCDQHPSSSGVLINCLIGSVFVINSYLLNWVGVDSFAAELCAIIGALVLGLPIISTAVKDLLKGQVYMNELVALAILASFVQQDFKSAGLISFFMLLSLVIEQKSAVGARASIEALVKLTPRTARLLGENGEEVEVDAVSLEPGASILVRAGENFPADGIVESGATTVNEASITGESLPYDKVEGETVFAGTENLTGLVKVRVVRAGDDTTLGKVRHMIEQAESNKSPVMRLIDKYVGFYTPTVLVIAAMVWFFTGDMDRVVAVLVVACPCAIVLAAPSATVAALAAAARSGLLFKDVSHLEVLAEADAFVFDKTGTLTKGNLAVSLLHPMEGVDPQELLSVAVQAECVSNHPVAEAIRKLADDVGVKYQNELSGDEQVGKGVEVNMMQQTFRAGRLTWFKALGLDCEAAELSLQSEKARGLSIVAVARDRKVLGWIGLSDEVREHCAEMVHSLKRYRQLKLCMVTGDNGSVASKVAKAVGIDFVKSSCLPEDKVAFVEDLRKSGAKVVVIGDGVNDAPALAAGDSSVAMGAVGSDIAVNSAAIALMNTDLRKIPFLLKLARRTKAVMNQNISVGLLFVIGGLYLSAMGLLSPVVAAVIHTCSSLFIIFNSARLIKE